MKVKTLISVMLAGLLATGVGFAAADDNVGTDTSNSTATSGATNSTPSANDTGEMGGGDNSQSDNASGTDTATQDSAGNSGEEEY